MRTLALTLGLAMAGACLAGSARAEPVQPDAQRIMVVVAHQDDDIMVAVPDLLGAVGERRTIQTVYLTSGDAGFTCNAYTYGREAGAKARQAELAGVPNRWTDSEFVIAGKHLRLSQLAGTRQSMIHVGLPNPALLSKEPPDGALEKLWRGQISQLATLPYDGRSVTESYTREQLIEVLRALMTAFGAQDVRILDASQQQIPIWPFEHVDHMGSAMFAMAALQRYAGAQSITFYPLYSVQFQPVNLSVALTELRRHSFDVYRPFDAKMCTTALTTICGGITTCDPMAVYDPFWPRHYPADTVRSSAAQIRSPSGLCLDLVTSDVPTLRQCDGARAAQRWSLERGGVVRNAITRQCLAALSASPGQALSMRDCRREPSQQFYLTTQKQLRGPDATCVREGHDTVDLAECTVDPLQLNWLAL